MAAKDPRINDKITVKYDDYDHPGTIENIIDEHNIIVNVREWEKYPVPEKCTNCGEEGPDKFIEGLKDYICKKCKSTYQMSDYKFVDKEIDLRTWRITNHTAIERQAEIKKILSPFLDAVAYAKRYSIISDSSAELIIKEAGENASKL
mgnify:CR=1 FL=1